MHKSSTENVCTNGWRICWTSVCCPFVHKRLANISDVRLLSVCARTIDWYFGTKRKREFNENQENNTLGESKQLSQEKSQTLVPKHTHWEFYCRKAMAFHSFRSRRSTPLTVTCSLRALVMYNLLSNFSCSVTAAIKPQYIFFMTCLKTIWVQWRNRYPHFKW